MDAEAASIDDTEQPIGVDGAMVAAWDNGRLAHDWIFARVRERADAARR